MGNAVGSLEQPFSPKEEEALKFVLDQYSKCKKSPPQEFYVRMMTAYREALASMATGAQMYPKAGAVTKPKDAQRIINFAASNANHTRRSDAIQMISDISSILSHDLDSQALISSMMDMCRRSVGADRCSIFMIDREKEELVSTMAVGVSSQLRVPLNSGIAGYVARTGEIVNVRDVSSDPRFNSSIDAAHGYKSNCILAAPIKSGDEIVGVVQLLNISQQQQHPATNSHRRPRPITKKWFNRDDEELLKALVIHVGFAIHNQQLVEGSHRESRRSQALLVLLQAGSNDINVPEPKTLTEKDNRRQRDNAATVEIGRKIERLVLATSQILSADRSTLFLIDRKKQRLFVHAGHQVKGLMLPLGVGIVGTVAKSGATVNIPDVYLDHRFDRATDKAMGYRTRSLLCMPVRLRGAVIAVIQVMNKEGGAAFDGADEAILNTVCSELGSVIDRNQLALTLAAAATQAAAATASAEAAAAASAAVSAAGDAELNGQGGGGEGGGGVSGEDVTARTAAAAAAAKVVAEMEAEAEASGLLAGYLAEYTTGNSQASEVDEEEVGDGLSLTDTTEPPTPIPRTPRYHRGVMRKSSSAMNVKGLVNRSGSFSGSSSAKNSPTGDGGNSLGRKGSNYASSPLSGGGATFVLKLPPTLPGGGGANGDGVGSIKSGGAAGGGVSSRSSSSGGEGSSRSVIESMVDGGVRTGTRPQERVVPNGGDAKTPQEASPIKNGGEQEPAKGKVQEKDTLGEGGGVKLEGGLQASSIATDPANVELQGGHGDEQAKEGGGGGVGVEEKGGGGGDGEEGKEEGVEEGGEEDSDMVMTKLLEGIPAELREGEGDWGEGEFFPAVMHWSFDATKYAIPQLLSLTPLLFDAFGLAEEFIIPMNKLANFIVSIQEQYLALPYHSFYHGFSVAHACCLLLLHTRIPRIIKPIELLAIMVSTLCHDVGHDGYNNDFHVKTLSEVAITYSDRSVLESMSAAITFTTLRDEKCSFLSELSREQFTSLRAVVVATVLATDMSDHVHLSGEMRARLLPTSFNRHNYEDRLVLMQVVVHAVDLSNPALPNELAVAWADRVLSEFNRQAAKERELGIDVTPFMTATVGSVAQARLNIGFIEYIVQPLWSGLCDFAGGLEENIGFLETNLAYWRDLADRGEALAKQKKPSQAKIDGASTPSPRKKKRALPKRAMVSPEDVPGDGEQPLPQEKSPVSKQPAE